VDENEDGDLCRIALGKDADAEFANQFVPRPILDCGHKRHLALTVDLGEASKRWSVSGGRMRGKRKSTLLASLAFIISA
jgi:hypothetical protein